MVKRFLDSDAPVVAVAAPAGYGKTSTLVLWATADERPFAWVQLTAADNDPVHLGRHIALALDTVRPAGEQHLARLLGAGRSADLEIFPVLAHMLEERAPMVLVLDDVHLLTSEQAIHGIEAICTTAAPGSQIAISGRHLPVHMGRQHMGDEVLDIHVEDLAMDHDEARLLFERADLELSEAAIADLVLRTEGWPGGLHLATLVLHPGRPADAFSGRDRLVGEYLVGEVLDITSAEMVDFLERSATLEYLDADLLDSFLERSDSGAMLTAIEASGNMFLVPLDNEGSRYRYHHLFRDLLRQRLRTRDPALDQRLESRASVLLERVGDIDGAVRHAIEAHEFERAANLILGATFARLFDGRHAQIGEWLALLGDDAIDRYPAAALATAWHGVACGDHERIAHACLAGERFGWHGPLADGSPSLPVALATVRIFLAADGVQGVIRDAEIVRDGGGPAWNAWWGFATGAKGTAHIMLGELELGRSCILEALAASPGAPYIEAMGSAYLALVSLLEDDHVAAEQLASRARRIADHHRLDGFVPTLPIYAVAALVAARTRRPDEARSAAATAQSLIVRVGEAAPRALVLGFLLLAQSALVLGDRAEARELLRQGQRARRRDPSATFLNDQLDALAEQLTSAGDLSSGGFEPLSTAELRVLDYLPTHLSLREIAEELLISRNTAKSHSVAIYRKLGVSSRADAVRSARQLGLLPSA